MQFNRDEAGPLHPPPNPSAGPGVGLERLTAVRQHGHPNYERDLLPAPRRGRVKCARHALDRDMGAAGGALEKRGKRADGMGVSRPHDTAHFPVATAADIGRERGFTVDMDGYNTAMEDQRRR